MFVFSFSCFLIFFYFSVFPFLWTTNCPPMELNGKGWNITLAKHCRKVLSCKLVTENDEMARNLRCLVSYQAPATKLTASIVTKSLNCDENPATWIRDHPALKLNGNGWNIPPAKHCRKIQHDAKKRASQQKQYPWSLPEDSHRTVQRVTCQLLS